MPRLFALNPITPGELTSTDLKHEAQRQRGNSTLEIYHLRVDRELPPPWEVLYVGDQRIAMVAWKGNMSTYQQVGSTEEAVKQVLQEMGE